MDKVIIKIEPTSQPISKKLLKKCEKDDNVSRLCFTWNGLAIVLYKDADKKSVTSCIAGDFKDTINNLIDLTKDKLGKSISIELTKYCDSIRIRDNIMFPVDCKINFINNSCVAARCSVSRSVLFKNCDFIGIDGSLSTENKKIRSNARFVDLPTSTMFFPSSIKSCMYCSIQNCSVDDLVRIASRQNKIRTLRINRLFMNKIDLSQKMEAIKTTIRVLWLRIPFGIDNFRSSDFDEEESGQTFFSYCNILFGFMDSSSVVVIQTDEAYACNFCGIGEGFHYHNTKRYKTLVKASRCYPNENIENYYNPAIFGITVEEVKESHRSIPSQTLCDTFIDFCKELYKNSGIDNDADVKRYFSFMENLS